MTKKTTRKIGGITLSEEVVKGERTGRWKIDIPIGLIGNRKRKRHGFSSRTAAENEARAIMKRVQVSDRLIEQGRTGFTLDDVFEDWKQRELVKIAAGRKKKSSLKTDLNCLVSVMDYFVGMDLAEITREKVEDYQAHRKQAGRAETTINTECRKLKAVLRWCFSKRLLERMPEFDPLEEPPLNYEVPTLDEMVLILREMPTQVAVYFRLMVETGLRKDEARRLRWESIDLERRTINVGQVGERTPKTKYSYRTVSFGTGLQADLLALCGDAEWVFPSRVDPTKHFDNCRKSLKSAVVRSGVTRNGKPMKLTAKYGRKAFTSYQWINGVPLELIKKLVGHSPKSKATEVHYLCIPDTSIQEAVFELDMDSKSR